MCPRYGSLVNVFHHVLCSSIISHGISALFQYTRNSSSSCHSIDNLSSCASVCHKLCTNFITLSSCFHHMSSHFVIFIFCFLITVHDGSSHLLCIMVKFPLFSIISRQSFLRISNLSNSLFSLPFSVCFVAFHGCSSSSSSSIISIVFH